MVNPFSQITPYSGVGWVATGTPGFPTGIFYDGIGQRVAFNGTRINTNDCIVQDLTDPTRLNAPIDDNNWRLRLRLSWNGTNAFRNTGALFEQSNSIDI